MWMDMTSTYVDTVTTGPYVEKYLKRELLTNCRLHSASLLV